MDQIPLITSSTVISAEKFWNSIFVYLNRPHLINRKLMAASPVLFCELFLPHPSIKTLYEVFTWEALIYEIRQLKDLKIIDVGFLKRILVNFDKNLVIEEKNWSKFKNSLEGKFISIRNLFPRKCQDGCFEFVILDKEKRIVTFFAVQEKGNLSIAPPFPYHIQLDSNNNLRVLVNSIEDADTESSLWLVDKLFPKLLKWTENDIEEDATIKSLSLVAPDEYCKIYVQLKLKYGIPLVQKWPTKAKTDPQKYVYEDVAIASYLICLWRTMNTQDVNFVDCGCGNGLLVYILSKEGYKGCGFDIRRRKTWDLFLEHADLRVGTITPESVFVEATWLIGNHSDELSPWIPVIALNSSPKTNYFALPCCSYDFNGRKYVRVNSSLSQYGDYLNYIQKISNTCGFLTTVDKLRIPSTKRTCIIGVREKMDDSQLDAIKTNVSELISKYQSSDLILRDPVEKIRNCTQLDKNLIQKIIHKVVEQLLKQNCFLTKDVDGKVWNRGGTIHLSDLSKEILNEDKHALKREFGGLQTLLKNHRYIFKVGNGLVTLQEPLSLTKCDKYKKRICWFFLHHPDGCFFTEETCAYKH